MNKYKKLTDDPLYIAYKNTITSYDYILPMITMPRFEMPLRYPSALELYMYIHHAYNPTKREFSLFKLDNIIRITYTHNHDKFIIFIYANGCAISNFIIKECIYKFII